MTGCDNLKKKNKPSSSNSSNETKTKKVQLIDKIFDISNDTELPNIDNIKYIEREPSVMDYTEYYKDVTTLPKGKKTVYGKLDVCSADLSKDDLSFRLYDLMYTTYDNKTIWPDKLPDGFNPKELLELYKNPGLNLRQLQAKGMGRKPGTDGDDSKASGS